MSLINQNQWESFLKNFPSAHILQTSHWGKFKSNYGWSTSYIRVDDSGAQILFRALPFGYTIAYIPKGPVGSNWKAVLDCAIELSRKKRSIVLYVEPDIWEEQVEPHREQLAGFQESHISIQPRRTIEISLEGTEENWLDRMKQKTRYNIRLAAKKEVQVEKSSRITTFNQLIQVTSQRDQFEVHDPVYYRDVFEIFSETNQCELLIAKYHNIPLAALIIFFRGKRAWYFYGASNNQERNRMPTYFLQFEAMRSAAARGCTTYDLWGIPDFDFQTLEENFMQRSDGLWGVYRFKRGFGGEIKRTAGVFEKPIYPILYPLYQAALRFKNRSFG